MGSWCGPQQLENVFFLGSSSVTVRPSSPTFYIISFHSSSSSSSYPPFLPFFPW
jgi:hypothetical protein